ncbi:MAG: cytidine deaminase [Legionellales bacterium]|nr:cytidine deaminase [Legionellales bacterium]|tara:strand:- start:2951 stop:3352 length:402 start_codon:yes stop_codon:yes gene_type:complete
MTIPEDLIEHAKAAQSRAYAPYSQFAVGCCIRTAKGNVYSGCNIENASYSLTCCAEATAIAAMVSAGEHDIAEVVVIGTGELPCWPCGACRQRIREFANSETLIHMHTHSGSSATKTLDELLPVSFGPENLEN